jgi:CheY-like chemotaxis protein
MIDTDSRVRPRAVIVDDDPLVRRFLRTILDRRGYEVLTFADPVDCPLHLVPRCPCPAGTRCTDVILSDVQMREIDGINFVETLTHKGCRQPHFALMSATWSTANITRAGRLRCPLFAKPFETASVFRWLEEVEQSISTDRTLLEWHQLAQAAEA